MTKKVFEIDGVFLELRHEDDHGTFTVYVAGQHLALVGMDAENFLRAMRRFLEMVKA